MFYFSTLVSQVELQILQCNCHPLANNLKKLYKLPVLQVDSKVSNWDLLRENPTHDASLSRYAANLWKEQQNKQLIKVDLNYYTL